MDENQQQPEEEKMPTYSETVQRARETGKTAFRKKREADAEQKILLSPEQEEWAESTLSLLQDPRFKKYLEFEATLMAASLQTAFLDRGKLPKNATFGEVQALNQGFYLGLKEMKIRREGIWGDYIRKRELKAKHEKGD